MSISKVAKLANVSTATVSRFINHSGTVAPKTIERIQKAMAKAGYVPKPFASRPGPRVGTQHRGDKKTGIIAFVVCMKPSAIAESQAMASVVHGAEEALTQRGFSMVQIYVQEANPLPPILSRGEIDGSLIVGPVPPSIEPVLSQHPRVTLTSEQSLTWDHVFCDNEAIGNLAFEYLRERGHRRVAFLSLNKDHVAGKSRQEAFCHAAEKSQIPVNVFISDIKWDDDFLKKPQLIEAMCKPIVEKLLELPDRPTGLFIPIDSFTAILYPVLIQSGIFPGKDIDIISCNNETMLLAGLTSRPATIDIKAEYIGQRGVEQLCWRIEHPEDPTTIEIKIKPKLITSA